MSFEKFLAKYEAKLEKVICQAFIEKGINPEIAKYLFRGIGQDCRENWTEQKFNQWVDAGIAKYGMTIDHYKLVNQMTQEMSARIKKEGMIAVLG